MHTIEKNATCILAAFLSLEEQLSRAPPLKGVICCNWSTRPRVISFEIRRFRRKCLAIFQKRNILWHTSCQPQYTTHSMLSLAVPEFINQSSHVTNTYLSALSGHKSCERLT